MKISIKTMLLTVILVPLAYSSAVAQTVIFETDFTTLADGGLNGQAGFVTSGGGPDGSPTIVEGVGAIVDGFETAVNTTASDFALVTAGETYTSTINFTFDDLSNGVGGGPHLAAAIFAGDTPGSDSIRFGLIRSGDEYRLGLTTNFGNAFPDFGVVPPDGLSDAELAAFNFNQSATVNDETLGIDFDAAVPDTDSDLLTLTLELTATSVENEFEAVGILSNGTTELLNIEISELFGSPGVAGANGTLTFNAGFGDQLFGGFGIGQSDGNQNIANRTLTSASFSSSLVAVPEPSTLGALLLGMTGLVLRRRR